MSDRLSVTLDEFRERRDQAFTYQDYYQVARDGAKLQAALDTVLAKHRPEDGEPCCYECGFTFPCPHVQDITGALTGEGSDG